MALKSRHRQLAVDLVDEELEELGIHALHHGVTRVLRLVHIVGDQNHGASTDVAVGQELLHLLGIAAPERGGVGEHLLVHDRTGILLSGALLHLELDVTEVENTGDNAEHLLLHFGRELEDVHGVLHVFEVLVVRDSVDAGHAALAGVVEQLGGLQLQLRGEARVSLRGGEQLVEDVVVSLALRLEHHTGLLEEVVDDTTSDDGSLLVEVHRDELSETRRVVISQGLGVSESLEDRVSGENLGLEGVADHRGRADRLVRHVREELQDELGRLGLAGAGLSGDDDGLVGRVGEHVVVRVDRNAEHVRRLAARAGAVRLENSGRVQGQELERVHGDQNGGDVRVDAVLLESDAQVVENGHLVEVRDVHQVLDRRVHGLGIALLAEGTLLSRQISVLSVLGHHASGLTLGEGANHLRRQKSLVLQNKN